MTRPSRRSHPAAAEPLRRIPSVEKLLSSAPFGPLIARWGRPEVKDHLVRQLEAFRKDPGSVRDDPAEIGSLVGASLDETHAPSLRPVVNATGVIIHTNLGRSPLDPEVVANASALLTGYSNLEFDLEKGSRGRRDEHVSALAARLFGCDGAILVNNNAAAVLLLLAATSRDREVIVSRGELVEIGGSFRVPEVIVQGGARLREVGTTNRTRARDYASAVSPSTGAILRVHRSNFEIVGFTESATVEELVAVAREKKVPFFYDEGSGRVVDLERYGFGREATLRELIALGVDAVTCSADKLLGATQGGLILGRREILDRCAAHPLMRALRVGKETYALVAETLRAFLTDRHEQLVPVYRMLSMPLDALRERASAMATRAGGQVIESRVALGGGTTPTQTITSAGIAFAPSRGADALRAALLALPRPIVGRIEEDRFVIDVRTIAPEDDAYVANAIAEAMSP